MNIDSMSKLVLAVAITLGCATLNAAPQTSRTAAASQATQVGTAITISNHFTETAALDTTLGIVKHRFMLALPKGATLRPLPQEEDQKVLLSEIQVIGSNGGQIGTIDAPWAEDAKGLPLVSYYQIKGNSLVLTVNAAESEAKSATAVLVYTGAIAQTESGLGASAEKGYVSVPLHYIYRPSLGWHHDYCSLAPDEYPNPYGVNASFRGPCARHDLCYMGRTISKYACDVYLLRDMNSNCDYYYSAANPIRYSCRTTALVYHAAVVTAWSQ
jgi:hypothetical protein